MPTALVTGANRGIGLEFVRQYAADGWRVHAACRNPDKAKELKAVAGDVQVHRLDVTNAGQRAALARSLGDEALDLLINNAGVGGPDDSFGRTDEQAWLETLHINAIAPVRVAEQLVNHVARSRLKLLVSITSKMGSIADNSSGDSYAYRTSKAALNMAAKSMAVDLEPRGIIVVVFHPGWVKTDMGGSGAPITAKESVESLRSKIATLRPADSGKFFNYDGRPLPW